MPTFDLTAKIILGRATMRHLRAMVIYFSTKSAMPTIHRRSKRSRVSRLGFRKMRLEKPFREPDVTKGQASGELSTHGGAL